MRTASAGAAYADRMLRVRLLGTMRLESDGQAVPAPSSRRGRALLAWLALHPGIHLRSELAARLRPDVLDESARLSLRQAAWDVRRALGRARGRLVATRERIGLAPGEDLSIDVWDLERLLDEGRIDDALELRGEGELLEGLDDEWVYEARDRERERLAAELATAAAREEEQGDLERAVWLTRTWASLDPLAEAPGRELIRRLDAAGDGAAAVAAFERLAERLRRGLGVAPSRQTRALVEQIRTGGEGPSADLPDSRHGATALAPRDAAATGERPPLPGPLAPALAQHELVGRERELEQLLHHWATAAAGTAGCAVVAGEAGIGKTRLLSELCRTVHAQGAIILLGRCDADPLTSYQPFVEALRRWAATERGDAVRRHAAAAGPDILPLLPELLEERAKHAVAADRFRMFEAVASLLTSIARERPLLLALDDVHDADRPSLLLLRHLLRGRHPAPLLTVATYRHTDLGPQHPLDELLGRLRREGLLVDLQLAGLERAATEALVGRQLGSPPPALAGIIHDRARGNPFFAAELARSVAASGATRRRDGRWHYELEVAQRAVPQVVNDLIAARLRRLSEPAQAALRVAAVLGHEFELDVLARLRETDEERLLDALEEARDGYFVIELPQPGCYRFAHPLVRETLYDRLSSTRRARLHARAGEALEELRGDDAPLAALARHFGRGAGTGRRRKAIDYAAAAAEEAMRHLAYEDALARWDEALELVPERDEERRRALLRRRGVTYVAQTAWLLHAELAPRLTHIAPTGATSDPA